MESMAWMSGGLGRGNSMYQRAIPSYGIWETISAASHHGQVRPSLPFWPSGPHRLLTEAEDIHWTLAFHATERPDDPPLGVWKFDHTSFDDANLALQQRDGYTYARIARLEYVLLVKVPKA